jgi:Domain of unknown function (DUF4875)
VRRLCKIRALIGAIAVLGASSFGCSRAEEASKPQLSDVSKASPYKVLGQKTWSFMSAERGTVFISSPGAVDFEGRAQTVMKAALDLSEQYRLDDTEVLLVPDEKLLERGTQYARAVYRKDKARLPDQDTWTVTSSDDVLTEKELAIARLWFENADRFETKEGYTDHERLNRFIAKQMNMRAEELELPAPMTRPYEPKYK